MKKVLTVIFATFVALFTFAQTDSLPALQPGHREDASVFIAFETEPDWVQTYEGVGDVTVTKDDVTVVMESWNEDSLSTAKLAERVETKKKEISIGDKDKVADNKGTPVVKKPGKGSGTPGAGPAEDILAESAGLGIPNWAWFVIVGVGLLFIWLITLITRRRQPKPHQHVHHNHGDGH